MKKITYILLILLLTITIVGCNNKKEEKNDKKEVEKIVKEEINEGEIEGYKFKVVDKETDRVKIQMENGDIMLIVLSNSKTPITIKNFKKLVSEKYYDGLIFHRVIKDFMIQGGDITGTGFGSGEEKTIKGEFSSNGVENTLKHTRGVISMARSGNPNSASTQFFIIHKDSPHLDGDYAAFGKVFAGMSAVDKIAEVEGKIKPLEQEVANVEKAIAKNALKAKEIEDSLMSTEE